MSEYEILHFLHLFPLLLEGHVLTLNQELGTLAELARDGEGLPIMLKEQSFTRSELLLLVPILSTYPHHCPYEVLLASFSSAAPTELDVQQARKVLRTASERSKHSWDEVMRPVRNVLSRTRLKIQVMGLTITNLFEVGYLLMPRRSEEEEGEQDVS